MEVLEWLKGLDNLMDGDADHVQLQAQIVCDMKRRARTLEIALTKGWTVGNDLKRSNVKWHTLLFTISFTARQYADIKDMEPDLKLALMTAQPRVPFWHPYRPYRPHHRHFPPPY